MKVRTLFTGFAAGAFAGALLASAPARAQSGCPSSVQVIQVPPPSTDPTQQSIRQQLFNLEQQQLDACAAGDISAAQTYAQTAAPLIAEVQTSTTSSSSSGTSALSSSGSSSAYCNQVCSQTNAQSVNNGAPLISQVQNQCLAYQSSGQSHAMDYVLLGLDGAAIGTCAPLCFSPGFGSTLSMACSWAGMSASATEVLDGIIQANGAAGKAMAGLMGAAGIALPMILNSKNGGALAGLKGQATAGANGNRISRMSACITLATTALDFTTRIMSLRSQSSDSSSACQNIVALTGGQNPYLYGSSGSSSGTSSGASSGASSGTSSGTSSGASSGTSSGSSGNGSSSGASSGGASSGSSGTAGSLAQYALGPVGSGTPNATPPQSQSLASQVKALTACMVGGQTLAHCGQQAFGNTHPAMLAGATGSLGPLSTAGQSSLASQLPTTVPSALSGVASGASPSSMLGAMGSAAGLSDDQAAALGKYGAAIAASGIGPIGDVEGSAYKGGGGPAAPAPTASSGNPGADDPLAGFAADDSPLGGGPDQLGFGAGAGNFDVEGHDIYHRDMPGMNLFQIVTHRYGKVKDRVDKLDWMAPFNHAMSR